jgi:hypothetical protein
VNDWIHSAVKPLVMLAKQHFRPDAGPISAEMWFRFSVEERCFPEIGASTRQYGPDTGILGLFHSWDVSVGLETVVAGAGAAFKEGVLPMMPPSIKLIAGAEVWKRAAISRAVRGDMAFRSR